MKSPDALLFAAVLAATALAGCGQTGPLYMPQPPAKPAAQPPAPAAPLTTVPAATAPAATSPAPAQ